MPSRSKRPCRKHGCNKLVEHPNVYCENHRTQYLKKDNRPSAAKRGYDRTWRKYREKYLIDNQLCVKCLKVGKVLEATVVDHIIPHKGNMKLFWDRKNHQSLCETCHNKKTASEDGGFGNKRI